MTDQQDSYTVKLSPSDIKDREHLAQQLESFTRMLFETAAYADEDEDGDMVISFTRDNMMSFALTMHQILVVLRAEASN